MLNKIWPFRLYGKIKELEQQLKKTKDTSSFMAHELKGAVTIAATYVRAINKGRIGKIDESVQKTLEGVYLQLKYAEDAANVIMGAKPSQKQGKNYYDMRLGIIDPIFLMFAAEFEKLEIFLDNTYGSIPPETLFIKECFVVELMIIFRNLLSNVLKYGGFGCAVAMGYRSIENFRVINVFNSGRPISEDFQARLFEKYEREGGSAEGSGIGLYHVRELIEKLGGKIEYKTTSSGHPNFLLYLPEDIFEK